MNTINSIYRVTDGRTQKSYEIKVSGQGQQPIALLREEYPLYSKFLLEGFEVDGNFIPAEIY